MAFRYSTVEIDKNTSQKGEELWFLEKTRTIDGHPELTDILGLTIRQNLHGQGSSTSSQGYAVVRDEPYLKAIRDALKPIGRPLGSKLKNFFRFFWRDLTTHNLTGWDVTELKGDQSS